ncbi:MAG: twin-arginine translocase TatA/TatE family subunit [Woeseiaceae bacterium]|nr:twin-arginine translocase TatA/TatE family subunit [Woeseiaceae bacterium]
MSGASFQEFFLLVVIGLVILGPKRLPQVANQIGSWLGQARRMTRMMKRQLEEEINLDLDNLNNINVKQKLGLEEASATTAKKPDVTTPSYVHDPNVSKRPQAAAAGAAATEVEAGEKPELPDDYSPAHGSGDVGTGVGDGDGKHDSKPHDADRTVAADKDEPAAAGSAAAADSAEGKKEHTA